MGEYTEEMRKRDAKIAETIEWTQVYRAIDGRWWGHQPESRAWSEIPFFQGEPQSETGEHAKALLLHWLAEDGYERPGYWYLFIEALKDIIPDLWREVCPDYGPPKDADNPLSADEIGYRLTFKGLQMVMLATPEQVARAAVKALGIEQ